MFGGILYERITLHLSSQETALKEAEALLDMALISGNWDEIRPELVNKYMAAGLNKVAFFVSAANVNN